MVCRKKRLSDLASECNLLIRLCVRLCTCVHTEHIVFFQCTVQTVHTVTV
jgi:hypothetical protein